MGKSCYVLCKGNTSIPSYDNIHSSVDLTIIYITPILEQNSLLHLPNSTAL